MTDKPPAPKKDPQLTALRAILNLTDPEISTRYVASALQVDEVRARALVDQAAAELDEATNYDSNRERGRAILRLHDLYSRLVAINDFKAAAAVVKDLVKLQNLELPREPAPEKHGDDQPAPADRPPDPRDPLGDLRLLQFPPKTRTG